jgi:hypothetical protein
LPESLPREQVIHDLDESGKNQSYMWVYCTGSDSPADDAKAPPNIILYDDQNSRAGQCAHD